MHFRFSRADQINTQRGEYPPFTCFSLISRCVSRELAARVSGMLYAGRASAENLDNDIISSCYSRRSLCWLSRKMWIIRISLDFETIPQAPHTLSQDGKESWTEDKVQWIQGTEGLRTFSICMRGHRTNIRLRLLDSKVLPTMLHANSTGIVATHVTQKLQASSNFIIPFNQDI